MGNCFGSSRSVVPEPSENHAIERTGPHQPSKYKSVETHVVGVDDDDYGMMGKTRWQYCKRGLKREEKVQAERCEPKTTMDEHEIRRAKEKNGGGGGVLVSVRVVVTQRELQQIMKYQKHAKFSSVEEVLSAIRLRSGGEPTSSWRPSLDTIPEDH